MRRRPTAAAARPSAGPPRHGLQAAPRPGPAALRPGGAVRPAAARRRPAARRAARPVGIAGLVRSLGLVLPLLLPGLLSGGCQLGPVARGDDPLAGFARPGARAEPAARGGRAFAGAPAAHDGLEPIAFPSLALPAGARADVRADDRARAEPARRSVAVPAGNPEPLVVASDLDNPPFAGLDEDGIPSGRDVEMMQMVAGILHRPIEWRRMPFGELLDAAEQGRVDVVCATLGVTPERAQRVDFTRPYFDTTIAVVTRAGEGNPTRLAELAGLTVAAARGTTSERALRMRLPDALAVLEAAEGTTTRERLLSGEIDAAVMDAPAADRMVAGSGGRLRRLAEDLDVERYALALPRGRSALRERIDEALAHLAGNGTLDGLDRAHGLR